jgi:signal transduction histidine kinase
VIAEAREAATPSAVSGSSAARTMTPLHRAVVAASVVVTMNVVVLVLDQAALVRIVAMLVALAALCVATLALRRAPSLSWFAAIVAAYEASTIVFAAARTRTPDSVGLDGWLVVAVGSGGCAIATASIAGAYATRRGRRFDPIAVPIVGALVGWVVLACVTTVAVVLAGQRTPDPAFNWVDVATAPITLYLPVVIVLAALGAGFDVRAAGQRARERLGAGVPSAPRAWSLAIATARELIPGQAAAELAAQEAERARLAGDLHASVLPALRRAIADAEAGGDPEELARRLRLVDVELERLMADRWPIVLEAFGLVPALEDLAERLETDGATPVTIEVVRSGDRPPAPVERAAWRFAQVVLDNAVRHASPTAIEISIAADRGLVQLVVTDDGTGINVAHPSRRAGRGLADADRAAAEVGATVAATAGTSGGTIARFEWHAEPRPNQGRH